MSADSSVYLADVAMTLCDMGYSQYHQYQYVKAERFYLEALTIRKQLAISVPDVFLPKVAYILGYLANIQYQTKRSKEAILSYVEALEIYRKCEKEKFGKNLPEIGRILYNLGVVQKSLNQYFEAEKNYKESIKIRRKLAKNNPKYLPDLATTINNLAVMQDDLKNYADAEKNYNEALRIRRKLAKATPEIYEYEVANTLYNIAILFKNQKRLDEAIKTYLKSLAIYRKLSKTNSNYLSDVIKTLSKLAALQEDLHLDTDLEDNYKIPFCKIDSLGYLGSGEKIRDFNYSQFYNEIKQSLLNTTLGDVRSGYHWNAYDVYSNQISNDNDYRLDYKYWDPDICKKIQELRARKSPTISDLNTITTFRGKSPSTDCYVDEKDGYALVIKAGSNISKFGKIIVDENSDWVEKSVFEELQEKTTVLRKGDVLIASTGDGTLGKCGVYDLSEPAIADGHVTIIRVDNKTIDPYYLADYLRYGLGSKQITRLYSGSTGLIELTPEQIDSVVVDLQESVSKQKEYSKKIRNNEKKYEKLLQKAEETINLAKGIL